MCIDKIIALFALSALALGGTSCQQSDVFYAVEYDIQIVGAVVNFETTEPVEGEEVAPENPLKEQISSEVIAQSPMKAGGHYKLDFTRFDGGVLRVKTALDQDVVTGQFIKQPGSDSLNMEYSGLKYIAVKNKYTTTEGAAKLALVINLTEEFKVKYPDAKIVDVRRIEYTSSTAK